MISNFTEKSKSPLDDITSHVRGLNLNFIKKLMFSLQKMWKEYIDFKVVDKTYPQAF